jgi:hypothetical protein
MAENLMRAGAIAFACSLFAAPVFAQQGMGTGPVAQNCQAEIQEYCAGLEHGQRRVRQCLESNNDKVSEQCRVALETTGPGRRFGGGAGQKSGGTTQ